MTMATIVILPNHPYFDQLRPSVWQMANGKWTVRWRDFHTMKQDMEFETQSEALAFGAKLIQGPITIEDCWDDIADANSFWSGR